MAKKHDNIQPQHQKQGKKKGTFSMPEMFRSYNGQPSACKAVGSISALVCLALFVAVVVFYMLHVAEGAVILQILDKIIEVFGISAGILGIKSLSSSIGGNRVTIQNTTNADGTVTHTRTTSRRYAQSATPETDMETIGTEEYDASTDGYADQNQR